MKNADDILLSYLNSETSYQSCDLYVLKLADGTVYRFAAYDKDIVFDGDMRFRQLYESISVGGSRSEWYDHVKKVRHLCQISRHKRQIHGHHYSNQILHYQVLLSNKCRMNAHHRIQNISSYCVKYILVC